MRRTAIAALVLLAAGCANTPGADVSAADTSDRDCFNVNMISGFTSVDRDTIRVQVGASRVYELNVAHAACMNLDWAETIAVASRPSSFLCVGDGARVNARILTDRGDSCLVRSVSRVTEEPAEDTPDDAMGESDEG